eukprot:TRINITY_DN7033_c0_g1_i2.p1 TRINITY_DN7033_c0_g1~~TRINITY_DN7033_c0_g1_i2.p1  ORF type:complete len:162 (+),score=51.95 TRINITY_DN7033_c0_g1_i2:180-665(+)
MCIRDRYQRRVRGQQRNGEMTVFDFWIFNRYGVLLYYEQWHRSVQLREEVQETKLMHGLIYMLKQFSQKISPHAGDSFCSYKTPDYRLQFFESGTGLQFIMRTDPNQNYTKDDLVSIYSDLYVPYIAKNPMLKVYEPIESERWKSMLNLFIRNLPYFRNNE